MAGLPPETLAWLVAAAVLAGVVRGFAGFGTALVFMPIAARVTDPVSAVLTLVAMDLLGPLPAVPRALREGHPPDLVRLGLGLVAGVPFGVAVLTAIPQEAFRYAVCLGSLGFLALIVSGLRYRGRLTTPLLLGLGWVSGAIGGATTLFGPPVLAVYMAATLPPQVIRATMMVYLVMTDVAFLGVMAVAGGLVWAPLALGLALVLPYAAAIWLGGKVFRPERAGLYRGVAYALIAGAALSGLPWGG